MQYETTIDGTKTQGNVEDLEKSSSLFKHVISDIINFLTQNSYGSVPSTQHSSILRVSLDHAAAQCCSHEILQRAETFNSLMKELYSLNNQLTVYLARFH